MAEHKKKRKPRQIITTRHDDGTYSHEHRHDDGQHTMFAGTSSTLEDAKQHLDDHFGQGAPEAEAAPEAAPAPTGEPVE